MPHSAPRAKPDQAQLLRRGIEAARLLVEKPRTVEELGQELDLDERTTRRLLAGLREAEVTLEVEVDWRERRYSIRVLPVWLARAVRVLAER